MTIRSLPRGFVLAKGAHDPNGNGHLDACLLEAVAYVAGEPWSDHPECVSPVIAEFGRRWNDTLRDEDRQMLLPYVTRLVGTRGTNEQEIRRAWMCTDWLVREFTPAWLRLANLTEHAHTLENLVALTDMASAREAESSVRAARAAAGDAARDAAWVAARAAARSAARAAAWDAAWAAARAAAWDAARAAAGDAARAAAGDAARAAAGDAAWAAAADLAAAALTLPVQTLQKSALGLMDRMIEVTA